MLFIICYKYVKQKLYKLKKENYGKSRIKKRHIILKRQKR